jgi:RHS repeat-associated protein
MNLSDTTSQFSREADQQQDGTTLSDIRAQRTNRGQACDFAILSSQQSSRLDLAKDDTSYGYDLLDNLTTVSQGSQTRTFAYDSLKRLTSAANPESGTISYQYDSNGNLLVKTDARSVSTHYSYDALNRVIRRWYNGSSSTLSTTHNSPGLPSGVAATDEVTYTYDAVANSKGRLTSMSSSASATNYTTFDALGRLNVATQVTDGQTYSMSYGYNLASLQTSMTYPSNRVIQTGYDMAGRIAGVKDQGSGTYYAGGAYNDDTNRMKYAAHGAVSVMKLGNGLWEHTTFNNRLQPTQIGLGTSSTDSSTVRLSYTYGTTNNNGNVLTHGYAGGGLSYTQTFEYDPLNRLTTSGEGAGSWSETNLYDRYGNRSVAGGLSFSDITNRITTVGYSYDGAGNLKNDPTQSFDFDAENKITKVNGESDVYDVYRYDGDGNRVRKNFTYGEKMRMVYSGGQLIAEYDLSNGSLKKEYVYGANGLIVTIEPSGGTKYTTADSLGTPRVVTSSAAVIISRHDYMPFGQELGSGIGGRTPGIGYDAPDGVRQKFTQYERDSETGLDYAQARHFGSLAGRFSSPDPLLASANVGSPQSWNRYAYVQNNPVNFIDPNGLSICSAEFSYSDCGGDTGFWGGKGGFGDGVAEYKREYGGMPANVANALGLHDQRITNSLGGFGFLTSEQIVGATGAQAIICLGGVCWDAGSVSWTGSGSSDITSMGRLLTVAGTSSTIAEYGTVSPFSGAWRGANGQWNRAGWGGNGSTAGRSLAMSNARALRGLGRVVGIAGIGLSLIEGGQHLRQGERGAAAKSGLDAAFGGVGTFGGPYGAGAATIYFGIDMTMGWPAFGRQATRHPMITGVTPAPFLF